MKIINIILSCSPLDPTLSIYWRKNKVEDNVHFLCKSTLNTCNHFRRLVFRLRRKVLWSSVGPNYAVKSHQQSLTPCYKHEGRLGHIPYIPDHARLYLTSVFYCYLVSASNVSSSFQCIGLFFPEKGCSASVDIFQCWRRVFVNQNLLEKQRNK